VNAAVMYFVIVFGAGFAFGAIRTLWVVPRAGVRTAELMETPLMVAVIILACRSVVRLFALPYIWPRIAMGLSSLSMLIGAELFLNFWLTGRPVSAYISDRDPVSGTAYFCALGLFAVMPLVVGRRLARSGTSLIDLFMDEHDVAECHETIVHAPADLVFDVAEHFDLLSISPIKAIFALRERVFRVKSEQRRSPKGIVAETKALGWGVLAYRPGREIVMGAVTQPWVGNVKFRSIPPETFHAWSEPDFVKIAWTLEAEPLRVDVTRFRTQTRVLATDRNARLKFLIYWTFAGLLIVLIRRIGNRAIRLEAERRARAAESGEMKQDQGTRVASRR